MGIPEYQGVLLGVEARGTIAKDKTYRVRRNNQETMNYYTPTNPQTAPQQNWRTVLRAGVWEWSKMTPEEKEPWREEAKQHRNWSAYNTFMSAWLKGLWKEKEMRVPDYASAWTPLAQGEEKTLTHNLGGNPDDYLIKAEAKHPTAGINNIGIGATLVPGNLRGFTYGVVLSNTIKIKRYVLDINAPLVRIKIWRYA